MARRKLSKQQQRRISQSQKKRVTQQDMKLDEASSRSARVISHHGKALSVETEDDQKINCHIRQNLGSIACGDFVIIQDIVNQHDNSEEAVNCVATAIKPRINLLTKTGFGGAVKPVAANIGQIVIVVSVSPKPNPYLIDRYLVAAENLPAKTVIVINKADLLDDDTKDEIDALARLYRSIGYPVIYTSMKTGEGVNELHKHMKNTTSILVGLSGVGKSSIVNGMLPEENIKVGDTSRATGEGRHTTTVSALYHLGDKGIIIDSPGVRDFSPVYDNTEEVTRGFVDIREFSGKCKFSNCSHLNAPGCALRLAVDDGKLDQQRLDNYLKLVEETASTER